VGSVASRSITTQETIYIRLLDEGVDVWRPVSAMREEDGPNVVLDQQVPHGEVWEFPPCTHVRCEKRDFADGITGQLTAVSAVD
jgi:hypothetical protein